MFGHLSDIKITFRVLFRLLPPRLPVGTEWTARRFRHVYKWVVLSSGGEPVIIYCSKVLIKNFGMNLEAHGTNAP